ncbi:MAG: carbamoyl-phosphate synthase large subunit [Deltaproteobacteria bacterium]|nr:carbamoyl-phosphate synthase large subunit [Deltaproteobacteria bacterium]
MPKRTDIETIMLIGSGPIVIGQACEFDYSGTQACKALREEGYRIVLVNSNPATIMTDPDFADRTYIEPIVPSVVAKIIERERPDALLPTLGGQTALNTAVSLFEMGVLDKYNVELIGASIEAIKKAEDRQLFKEAMLRIGLDLPASRYARSMDDALEAIGEIGYPAIIRPSFTLGGTGGSVAYNREEYESNVAWGLSASPRGEILVEESVLGWKEYELEVMRDRKGNVVIICSIENFDPMGVHTGDSITVAPAQTLTDKEYQVMRDASIAIMREIGVDTGGSNIQFGVNPRDGRLVVIEMNPRVSRSSALASKATGFPIAKIAAKLAVGYTLDEIPNDITRETPACFEPTIDYVVTKIPRFTFEKFPQAEPVLTTQMKSVGEVMAMGRTFKESLQKAIRSLEIDHYGFEEARFPGEEEATVSDVRGPRTLREHLRIPNPDRLWAIAQAFREGWSLDDVTAQTAIDPWFLSHIQAIVKMESHLAEDLPALLDGRSPENGMSAEALLREAKAAGMSDRRLAGLAGCSEEELRALRWKHGVRPVYKMVDTCGAEFVAHTPYLYSTYELEDEAPPTGRPKIIILGGGPNRIGQGIEFDYCCVHGAFALREDGYEAIMVNCNPETVSTDYDTSDRLYFEPLTLEDVLELVHRERPVGVIVQFGGQTPLKLAVPLERAGVPIIGTPPDAIDRAEDRERFQKLLTKLGLKQADNGVARSVDEALAEAARIGFPLILRPSYVLGGRAMEIIHDDTGLRRYMERAIAASPDHPVLIDKFLADATEVDVDAVADGEQVLVGGIMEHIEEAGVHSGDSACSLPPYSLKQETIEEIKTQTRALALELGVVGLMNVQFAVKEGEVYILEVNPRASRTAPFVSKATGIELVKIAARVMAGKKLRDMGPPREVTPAHVSVKEAVFPFVKFSDVDTILGPEMKSTGEVMGIDSDFGKAFAKAQIAAGVNLPLSGVVFVSVKDADKEALAPIAKKLLSHEFRIIATAGTAAYLAAQGVACEPVYKVHEGRPHVVDRIKNGDVGMVINTASDSQSVRDSFSLRRAALMHGVSYFTTIAGARAVAEAIGSLRKKELDVISLQEHHARL